MKAIPKNFREDKSDRRSFLKKSVLAIAGSSAFGSKAIAGTSIQLKSTSAQIGTMGSKLLVTNQYPWGTFYKREGRSLEDNMETALSEIKQSGADSLEPILTSVEQTERLSKLLDTSGLRMLTGYVNSTLHEEEQANRSIEDVLKIAKRAKALMGTKILVTNPSPIRWGGPENKTDAQLLTQAKALQDLGKALHEEHIYLAYHFHDPEFREGAREVHHMLASTDARYVKLCLDAHWAYRGAGDSNVALHDLIKLYGSRIVELHVRQSHKGVWSETFGPGDIDYNRLVKEIHDLGINPVVCMEQAVEKGSPETMNGLEAHRISHHKAREVFEPFLRS